MMAPSTSSRLAYIDWMRGLACVVMFQTHCYDAWLGGSARKSTFFMYSQLGGTLPAPLFLFLAGISLALVTNKLRQKGLQPSQIARTTIRRGAEILGLGFLFRLQEFVIAWGWAPWSDLLRVDVLNIIGVSLMLMGSVCWVVLSLARRSRSSSSELPIALAATAARCCSGHLAIHAASLDHLAAALVALATGVLHQRRAQSGPAAGVVISGFPLDGIRVCGPGGWISAAPRRGTSAPGGDVLVGRGGGSWPDLFGALARRSACAAVFRIYDWHTSPEFFLLRSVCCLIVLCAAYAWCRWGAGQWGFSPLVQLGKTSLLVYWVHIEFVYGRFSILPKRALDIRAASLGLLTIFLAMLLLSWLHTRLKGCGAEALAWLRPPARVG